jgi:TonB family protein
MADDRAGESHRGGKVMTMKILSALAGMAALSPASAEAAQPPEPWERVGKWEIWSPGRKVCAANREYPSLTRVSLAIVSDRHRQLSVSNPNWPDVAAGRYRMRLIVDGKAIDVVPVEEGRIYNSGRTVWVGPDFPARFAAASAIEIDRPDGGLERLELGGAAAAVARLPACVAGAPRSGSGSRASRSSAEEESKPARARTNLPAYFSSDDYPAAALRARGEGEVRFRLEVDRIGRVTSCTVTSSSGSAALDSTTCSVILRRARFVPARDAEGRPVPDSVSGSIVWTLPASWRRPPRP